MNRTDGNNASILVSSMKENKILLAASLLVVLDLSAASNTTNGDNLLDTLSGKGWCNSFK